MHFSGLCIIGLFALANAFSISNRILTLYKKTGETSIENLEPLLEDKPNSKLIVSTPGGLFGFYFMGVSTYIKENYNLSEYVFSGASAGGWNSLFLSLNESPKPFIDELLKTNLKSIKSILQLEKRMKSVILKNYKDESFDLDKLYLGVTVLDKSEIKLCIYNDFNDLEDAVDCCIASSHIPFITGGAFNIYRNKFSFDGGFYSYPYLNVTTPSLIIAPDIWSENRTNVPISNNVTVINCNFDNLININKFPMNLTSLYLAGYQDSEKNKKYLDAIFL